MKTRMIFGILIAALMIGGYGIVFTMAGYTWKLFAWMFVAYFTTALAIMWEPKITA